MTSLPSLWLPIVLSAVAVFLLSFVIHMLVRWHHGDFGPLPNEDAVMTAIGAGTPAGEYMFPWAGSMDAMKDPAWMEKRTRGPAGVIRVFPGGRPGMGKNLAMWFIYGLVIAWFAAYLPSRAFGPGARSAEIFRYTSTVAFLAYGMGMAHESVWYSRPWRTTIKYFVDAAIYAAAVGGVFVWLWPS